MATDITPEEALEIARFAFPGPAWEFDLDGIVPSHELTWSSYPDEGAWRWNDWDDVHAAEQAVIERGLGERLESAVMHEMAADPASMHPYRTFAPLSARLRALLAVARQEEKT
jgi:hypothetical protein